MEAASKLAARFLSFRNGTAKSSDGEMFVFIVFGAVIIVQYEFIKIREKQYSSWECFLLLFFFSFNIFILLGLS